LQAEWNLKTKLQDWKSDIMRNAIRHRLGLCAIVSVGLLTSGPALAQSGSAGGSIGNDDKSISGSRSDPRAVEPEAPPAPGKPADRAEPRRAARSSSSANFDGAWVVTSVGCGGTTTGAVMVSGGRVIGQGTTGYVSASGATSTVGYFNGLTVRGSGHLSAHSGSGTFRRSDGCVGRWTTTRQ
jgi:hypothetical protein